MNKGNEREKLLYLRYLDPYTICFFPTTKFRKKGIFFYVRKFLMFSAVSSALCL